MSSARRVSECEVLGRSVGFVRDSNAANFGSLQENSSLRWIRDFDLLIGLPNNADIHHSARVNWYSTVVPIGDEHISAFTGKPFPYRKNRDLSAEIGRGTAIALEYNGAIGPVGGLDLFCDAIVALGAGDAGQDGQPETDMEQHAHRFYSRFRPDGHVSSFEVRLENTLSHAG